MYANQQPCGARNVHYFNRAELGLLILRQRVMPRQRCSVRSARSCGNEALPETGAAEGYALDRVLSGRNTTGNSTAGRFDRSK